MRLHVRTIGCCGNKAATIAVIIVGRVWDRLSGAKAKRIYYLKVVGKNVRNRIDIIGIAILSNGISYLKSDPDVLCLSVVFEYSG